MPQISNRGEQMPASPIRKLVPFAEAAKARGTKVYHLNIGQPDIETPKAILDAVRHSDFKVLEYSHSAGNESYRRKLVSYYAQNGITVDHNQIIVTTGGSEAILFGFLGCLDAGDEVIIPEPFYANYSGFATEAGVLVKPVTSYIDNGFALPSPEDFEKAIGPRDEGDHDLQPQQSYRLPVFEGRTGSVERHRAPVTTSSFSPMKPTASSVTREHISARCSWKDWMNTWYCLTRFPRDTVPAAAGSGR